MSFLDSLTNPIKLYSRSEVMSKDCPVPKDRGLYSWFFKSIPPRVPTTGCVAKNGMTLLYVGISPEDEESKANLRERIKTHFRGNAEGSTLRRTLGSLLKEQSGFPLRRVGSQKKTKRMTFTHLGEQWLDAWMEKNAFVCWVTHEAPWEVEGEIFHNVSLPLNIEDNDHHGFVQELKSIRAEARSIAREMPIANEDKQQRSI